MEKSTEKNKEIVKAMESGSKETLQNGLFAYITSIQN